MFIKSVSLESKHVIIKNIILKSEEYFNQYREEDI